MYRTAESDSASVWESCLFFSLLTLHACSWLSAYSMTTSVEKTSVERRLLQGILFVAASPSRVPACRGRSSVMCVMEPKNRNTNKCGPGASISWPASGLDIICVEFLSSLQKKNKKPRFIFPKSTGQNNMDAPFRDVSSPSSFPMML